MPRNLGDSTDIALHILTAQSFTCNKRPQCMIREQPTNKMAAFFYAACSWLVTEINHCLRNNDLAMSMVTPIFKCVFLNDLEMTTA